MSASAGKKERKAPAVPKPSSSVIILSPRNQILLLARVKTSSSFASAHVFPGGNVDTAQDGEVPPESSFERHADGPAYRLAAIRECFEESGLLLAKAKGSSATGDGDGSDSLLIHVGREERERARRAVHANTERFVDWVAARGGSPDVDGLRPFTRFVTPTTVPRRFTTQMYLYMLPLGAGEESLIGDAGDTDGGRSGQAVIPVPTSDGGVEHTAAQFLWPQQWLDLARKGEAIMYPPQVYLISLIAPFFPEGEWSRDELQHQRKKCLEFLQTSSPPWADKVMSPDMVLMLDDGRAVLGLNKPGLELKDSGRSGDAERVILTRHSKEGPRDVEVRWKDEVYKEYRESQDKLGKGKI